MAAIPLSLYVHFPWCVKKCPYCDFNSHTLRGDLPERAYIDALIQDLRQQLEHRPDRLIETVFMGGGTPSLIDPGEIDRLMHSLKASGRLSPDAEVTLEANPGTLDEARFEDFLSAGVNRLSIGVQSFNDQLLRNIGRIHSAGQAQSAIKRAKLAGFQRINLDLMYGLPGQSVEAARDDVECALSQAVSHLSIYQLTLEPHTEFAANPPKLPDSEHYWSMHEQASGLLLAAGFEQYEVSAYSRADPCRHNLNYWQFGDYLAIGAGAHGKFSELHSAGVLSIIRYWNHRHPEAYLAAVASGKFAAETRSVPHKDRDFEFLMNALRLKAGFNRSDYIDRTRGDFRALTGKLAPFFARGWLKQDNEIIRASESGFRFLDSLLLECL